MRSFIFFIFYCFALTVTAQKIISDNLVQKNVVEYQKTEFDIEASIPFVNPYDQQEIVLDMVIKSPSGKSLTLPCYFLSGDKSKSFWKARFAPQETGAYSYNFQFKKAGKVVAKSKPKSFSSAVSQNDGFLHTHDYWTLRFDSGKPFRGIGENIGWEPRSFENPKWTFDYLLPTLSSNGANFFRLWMCPWSLPVAWKNVKHTKRYTNSDKYFNEGGIKRMDELVELSDSLGLHFMLSIDYHGAFIPAAEWKTNNYNKLNGGVATTPTDFFQMPEAKAMYKNKLRYLIARWGYSPAIGAWEFFNEIDNAVFTSKDSVLIPHHLITQWHDEMSTYLKEHDPYKHIVTTSISHRDIKGMNELPNIDLNQKHIYNHTNLIAGAIQEYTELYHKPYVIGEFGYDWNWDNVKPEVGPQFDFDYKRGLWYGMFSSTPILPMTWWWEFFDERNMTPYFRGVRMISDEMLAAGQGSFESVKVSALPLESYAVRCGDTYFVYLLNNSQNKISSDVTLTIAKTGSFQCKSFDPQTLVFNDLKSIDVHENELILQNVQLEKEHEIIHIFKVETSQKTVSKQQ
ncbi:MAG TPA: DUF5060 domain-containing protein [Cyclobacteriaceae bacterium]|nr:DUF5060 domain-containing protein [Cyclobacteriaceae bacterium]